MEFRKAHPLTDQMINHPPHYNAYSIEVIEVTRYCSFDVGNAVKYMLRHPYKGASEQDLGKALWYIDDYITAFGRSRELISKDSARKKLITLAGEYKDNGGVKEVHDALRHIAFDRIVMARNDLANAIHPVE